MRLILARCFSRMELLPLQEPHTVDLTGNLVRYLSRNFQKPLSLDAVARELGVSKYHLSHIFSSRLHTNFSEYVNFLRLNLARELLLTTDQSILELGLACGFSSQRTFNRVFRAHMGISPRRYREQNAGQPPPAASPSLPLPASLPPSVAPAAQTPAALSPDVP